MLLPTGVKPAVECTKIALRINTSLRVKKWHDFGNSSREEVRRDRFLVLGELLLLADAADWGSAIGNHCR
eukprot:scaffold72209_cov54-Cyclotella_meneghiniana.AAC.2